MPFLFLTQFACSEHPAPQVEHVAPLMPLRIGWQTTWATQGQLAVLLQNHSWLNEQGFEASFVGFSYGAPLNEGALAGEVDVLFTADQPALVLCNKDPDWGAIGRLMYNRVGTLVPASSQVQEATELQGANVAIPIGAAAHRETLAAVKGAQLNIYNMGVQEIAALVSAGEKEGKWGDIDAVSAWDPVLAELETKYQARAVDYGQVTSLIMMSDRYKSKYPEAAEKFGLAFEQAYLSFQKDPQKAHQDFMAHSQLSTSVEALDLAASIEPNLKEGAKIRLHLTEDDLYNLQSAADFMTEVNILKQALDAKSCIRQSALEIAP